jgi:predicted transcriptional regulator
MMVDLTDPTRALTPTLDGPVLAVLAGAGRPLTVGEIAQQAVRGSEIGIRRSVARLVEQGLVTATQMGRNLVHELNRDHVAARAALSLADLRLELWKRLRDTLSEWTEKPVHAAVFGLARVGRCPPQECAALDGEPSARGRAVNLAVVQPADPRPGVARRDSPRQRGRGRQPNPLDGGGQCLGQHPAHQLEDPPKQPAA